MKGKITVDAERIREAIHRHNETQRVGYEVGAIMRERLDCMQGKKVVKADGSPTKQVQALLPGVADLPMFANTPGGPARVAPHPVRIEEGYRCLRLIVRLCFIGAHGHAEYTRTGADLARLDDEGRIIDWLPLPNAAPVPVDMDAQLAAVEVYNDALGAAGRAWDAVAWPVQELAGRFY